MVPEVKKTGCEKYLFGKNSLFIGPFFGGGDYSGGDNF
jgi:hypothetical protein